MESLHWSLQAHSNSFSNSVAFKEIILTGDWCQMSSWYSTHVSFFIFSYVPKHDLMDRSMDERIDECMDG